MIAILALLAAGTPPGAAPFEGRIDVRVTSARTGQPTSALTERIFVSSLGSRSEKSREDDRNKIAILRLRAVPGVAFKIRERTKTYRVAAEQTDPGTTVENFTVERVGRATVNGYPCEHLVYTGDQGSVLDQWITKKLKGLEHSLNAANRPAGLFAAPGPLKPLQRDGLPVKMVLRSPSGTVVTWEVTRVERRNVPSRLFDITGYREQKGDD